MTSEKNVSSVIPLIRSLLPNGSDEELEEAQQAVIEYVATVLRIFDRIECERQDDSLDHMNDSRIEAV
jgi:hypothetical protein